MALSISEQQEAADVAATATRILQLDSVWTAGVAEHGNEQTESGVKLALADVAAELVAGLSALHEQVPFLNRFADELEVLLQEQEMPAWPFTGMSPQELPQQLRSATMVVDNHAAEEEQLLQHGIDSLRGIGDQAGERSAEGDLRPRMRAAISIIGGVVFFGLALAVVVAAGPPGLVVAGINIQVGGVLLNHGLEIVEATAEDKG